MPNVNVKVMRQAEADAVRKEVKSRVELFQERDKVMHNIRRYRLLRHKPFVPKAYQARLGGERGVKLPIMYRLVQTAVSAVAKGFPTFEAEPLSASDRKAAEDQSRAASLLMQAVDNQSRNPYLYGLYFTTFGDGLGVTKSVLGPWTGFPLPSDEEPTAQYNKRVAEFLYNHPLPFYSRIVDPLTCYPPQEEFLGNAAFIESAWRPTKEVMRSLNLQFGSNNDLIPFKEVPGGKPYPELEMPGGSAATVKVDEVWTNDSVAIVIAGSDKVFTFENTMGELPYEWGYADPSGVEDPANIGMSVAYPLYYLVPWIDTMVGIMAAWSIFAAPTPYTTQDPVPGVRPTHETAVETYQPGKMYHFATGRKPGVLSPPDVGKEVTQFLSFLIESADRGGLPALVSGAGVGTRLPALTYQAAFEAATDRLRPAVHSLERILSGTVQKWFRMIGRYDIPVKVNGWEYSDSGNPRSRRWATIRPAEARKARRVHASLSVDSTQDLIAKGTHAQFMMSAQLWDMERAMRFGGVENPAETRDKMAEDLIWRASLEPLAQAVITGDPDVARRLEEAQAAAEGGEGGGDEEAAGAPPGPGRNRKGVPRGRGGGRRGGNPTQRPRGNRRGSPGREFGRT